MRCSEKVLKDKRSRGVNEARLRVRSERNEHTRIDRLPLRLGAHITFSCWIALGTEWGEVTSDSLFDSFDSLGMTTVP